MHPQPCTFTLPDLRSGFPLPTDINPHYEEFRAQRWIFDQGVFDDRKARGFYAANLELLTARAYPYADRDTYENVCRFLNLVFILDEITDNQPESEVVRHTDTFLRALKEDDFDDGSKLCQLVKPFRQNLIRRIGPNSEKRFYALVEHYILNMDKECRMREGGKVLNLEEHTEMRRGTGGALLCFGLMEYCFGFDLPSDVLANEYLQRMYYTAGDAIIWANDIYSYAVEYERDLEADNVITVLIHQNKWDLPTAIAEAGKHYCAFLDEFNSAKAALARTHSFDPATWSSVQNYIRGMEHWIAANEFWSFETERYFGPARLEVERTRRLVLREKRSLAKAAPVAPAQEPLAITFSQNPLSALVALLWAALSHINWLVPSIARMRSA